MVIPGSSASPTRRVNGDALLEDEDLGRTVHAMGTSLVSWFRRCTVAACSPATRASSA
jgi:hypothetical protein